MWRTLRRPWAKFLIGLFIAVLVAWTAFAALLMQFPLWPWDWAYWTSRHVIRVAWAALTGQSMSVDLFPF
jgi:hypothetical protein